MRAVVQRVAFSRVEVDGVVKGEIGRGLLILLGVGPDDGDGDVEYLVDKVANLRVFEDEAGKMNLSVKDVGGSALAVSQFTLYADCRKGRRPSFTKAADPAVAQHLYEEFTTRLRATGLEVQTGQFGAHMVVTLANDGPVTILLDSKRLF